MTQRRLAGKLGTGTKDTGESAGMRQNSGLLMDSRARRRFLNSLWWNWREHRERRGARLTRRVREEYRVYSDRNATMRAAKRSVSAGMHRRSNAARVSLQAVKGWRGVVAAGALTLVLGGLTAAAGPLVQQAYQFRVTVDLISLNVTVTDARERFITDLIEEDFSVYEDGILQEIEAFSREDLPIRMVLLLDTSASMVDKMNFAQEAAVRFTETLRIEDVAQVVEFGSNANILQKFTNDHGELEHAIRMTQAGGTTKLHNAMYISLRSLERQRMEARRQAIILLSDGRDTSSLVTFEQVLDLTKDTDVVIYSISLQNTARRRGRRFSEAEHVLKNLAEETGGQWFFPAELAELDSVYARIAEELKSQYNVGYISNNPRQDGAWRRIVVQTNRPDLRVRTKLGYYAPG